jgi:hypothetical protein
MSTLDSTCTVIPPLRTAFTHRTNNTARAIWRRTLVPIHYTHIVKWHSTTCTSCLDNTNSIPAHSVFTYSARPAQSTATGALNISCTMQCLLNCNNILTNLKGSKFMPLTAEARVRSQASLATYVVLKVAVGGSVTVRRSSPISIMPPTLRTHHNPAVEAW